MSANQQTGPRETPLNYIIILAGDKDYKEATIADVEWAYVMQTDHDVDQNVVLKDLYDIGLINADKDCDIMSITNYQKLRIPRV